MWQSPRLGLFALLSLGVGTPALEGFDAKLAALSADTALVLHSQEIDEYPVWSKDGTRLGLLVGEEWQQVDLNQLKLQAAKWRGGQIIAVPSGSTSTPLRKDEALQWQKATKLYPRKARVGTTVVELRQEGFSTQLVVTKQKGNPEVRWSSDMENCHSLTVAPDKAHVAFLCELNGALILAVQ